MDVYSEKEVPVKFWKSSSHLESGDWNWTLDMDSECDCAVKVLLLCFLTVTAEHSSK